MRYIILVAGLLISISAGLWDRVSAYDIFLTLAFLGIIFELGSGSGSGSGGIELLPDSSDGGSGSDCGGIELLPDSSDGDSGSDWGGRRFRGFFLR
jgi:hypothetical protein